LGGGAGGIAISDMTEIDAAECGNLHLPIGPPNCWLDKTEPPSRWSRLYSMLAKAFVNPIDRKKRIVRSSNCSAVSGAAQQLAVRPICGGQERRLRPVKVT